ncbi:MAG: magnesium-translocating P-type ATPase [Gemmatimonadetes bacterium]|nr:magnesium-translocating P-type ATPase [Gemmatimonadota bacterium]
MTDATPSPTGARDDSAALVLLATQPAEAALASLGTRATGLTADEVRAARARDGVNRIAHEAPPTIAQLLWRGVANPFSGVLVVIAVLSGVTGDLRTTIVITAMIVLSAVLRVVQEHRSHEAAAALKALVHTRAAVTRAGGAEPTEIPMDDIVRGDIVHVSAGDMIPADVRLLTSKDLFLSQSALTGESLPVEKEAQPDPARAAAPALEQPTLAFMGTSVVSGAATAVVVATGDRTVLGLTARGVAGARPPTAFDAGVRSVSWLLVRFMLVLAPSVFLINGFTKGNWVEAFLFALAVAVGLTPELLPMIVTVNLAKGAMAMAKRQVVVKRLEAIQNFGAMDVLCTDKTGTLTQDRIVLLRYVDAAGKADDTVLHLAWVNSALQTGLRNLLDHAVLEYHAPNAPATSVRPEHKVDEIPWDFTRKRMSVVVALDDGTHQLVTKGAPEEVLAVCTRVATPAGEAPLDAAAHAAALATVQGMNAEGLRVVAVASRTAPARSGPYGAADEAGLTLAGFLCFLDPPKESAHAALAALAAQGVRVIVLTGDGDVTARHVCGEVGVNAGRVVLGPEVDALDDAGLGALVEETTVFAKLSPPHKARIVRALRVRGHTVGFMGDGINDAGALREADVGISVDTAVDVAKESADIILLEKSLLVLSAGVTEGRTIFGNIMKYIKMTASSNFGNVFSMVIASALLPFLPMLPIQLLVQNLLYDFSQTTIPFDRMDPEYLAVPRKWQATDIGRFMRWIGPVSSVFDVATFALLWWVFGARTVGQASLFQSGWFVEGLLSQTLIVHMIRTTRVPFLQSRATWPVLGMTGLVIVIGLAVPFTPVGTYLGLVPLPGAYVGWLGVVLLGYALLTQLVKRIYIARFATWL